MLINLNRDWKILGIDLYIHLLRQFRFAHVSIFIVFLRNVIKKSWELFCRRWFLNHLIGFQHHALVDRRFVFWWLFVLFVLLELFFRDVILLVICSLRVSSLRNWWVIEFLFRLFWIFSMGYINWLCMRHWLITFFWSFGSRIVTGVGYNL